MKFLFVSDFDYDENTGAAGTLIRIANTAKNLGYSVSFIWKSKGRFLRKQPNIHRLLVLPYLQYLQIKKNLLKNNYDVVIISQPHCWLAIRLLKKKYPAILFINRTHGWEVRIHQMVMKSTKLFRKKITYFFLKHCSNETVKIADAILCASSSDSEFIKAYYPKYASKVFFCSYGIEKDFLQLNYVQRETIITKFLFVGQYITRKGINDLKNIFKSLYSENKSFELTFIVHPNSIQDVKNDFSFISSSSKLNVLAWVDRKALIKIYQEHDVFLMPSYGEGFGKTTLEAMACGLCIIGYNEGAIKDFGKNRENMLVTEAGNLEDLHRYINFSIDNLSTIRNYGIEARKLAQQQTWENHFEGTVKMINCLKHNSSLQ